jgi:gluconolactonase
MMPVNRRVFGMARQGIADGIHVDDAGNVYTGEGEGVVVRNPAGKTIGVFNSQFFQADKHADALAMANFALAGDTLVFLSTTRLWTVKLAKTVVSQDSSIVN